VVPGFRGTNTLKVSFDKSGNASFQSEGHVVSTLTNVANGKVVHVDSAGRDAFSDAGVVHPDGTITFTGTLTGRDVRICTSHRNVLLKDVGFLAIVDTVDSQGNFLSQELVAHGREHTHALASSPHRISLAGNAIQQRAHPDVGGYGRFGMHLIAASRHPIALALTMWVMECCAHLAHAQEPVQEEVPEY